MYVCMLRQVKVSRPASTTCLSSLVSSCQAAYAIWSTTVVEVPAAAGTCSANVVSTARTCSTAVGAGAMGASAAVAAGDRAPVRRSGR